MLILVMKHSAHLTLFGFERNGLIDKPFPFHPYISIHYFPVRQEVNNFESSVVVQELLFAINHALYDLL